MLRTVKVVTVEPRGVLVLFDDQSSLKIKTAGPATILPGDKVKSVHEAKTDFKINFEDGSSATLSLADPGSSVAVRDKDTLKTIRTATDKSQISSTTSGEGQ